MTSYCVGALAMTSYSGDDILLSVDVPRYSASVIKQNTSYVYERRLSRYTRAHVEGNLPNILVHTIISQLWCGCPCVCVCLCVCVCVWLISLSEIFINLISTRWGWDWRRPKTFSYLEFNSISSFGVVVAPGSGDIGFLLRYGIIFSYSHHFNKRNVLTSF